MLTMSDSSNTTDEEVQKSSDRVHSVVKEAFTETEVQGIW